MTIHDALENLREILASHEGFTTAGLTTDRVGRQAVIVWVRQDIRPPILEDRVDWQGWPLEVVHLPTQK